jgi:site-specific recombinase XerD
MLKTFKTHLEKSNKSPHTVKAYTGDLRAFVVWWETAMGEDFGPQAVDPLDIQEYRRELQRQGRKPATINRKLDALRQFYKWAKRTGAVSDTPFDILENIYIKQQQHAPKWLDRSQQRALIRAVREKNKPRDLAIIQTLLGAGLRVSELVSLRLGDISLGERSGRIEVRSGKGGKARAVPLDNRTRQGLAGYLQARPPHDSKLLFLGQRGPLTDSAARRVVAKYAYLAKLEDVSPHTLRHTFAKNLLNAGAPLDQVANLLGHESLDTTAIYTTPSFDDLAQAVRKAEGSVG